MQNIEYKDKTYTQEKKYTDWFCMQTEITNTETVLHALADSLWEEWNGMKTLYHIENPTQNMDSTIEALHLITGKLHELAKDCEAMECRPEEGENPCIK